MLNVKEPTIGGTEKHCWSGTIYTMSGGYNVVCMLYNRQEVCKSLHHPCLDVDVPVTHKTVW